MATSDGRSTLSTNRSHCHTQRTHLPPAGPAGPADTVTITELNFKYPCNQTCHQDQSDSQKLQTAIEQKRMTESVRTKFEANVEIYRDEIMGWKAGAFTLQAEGESVASENTDAATLLQLKWDASDSKSSNVLLENIQKSCRKLAVVSHSEWSQMVASHFRFWMVYTRRPFDAKAAAPETPPRRRASSGKDDSVARRSAEPQGDDEPAGDGCAPGAARAEPSARQLLGGELALLRMFEYFQMVSLPKNCGRGIPKWQKKWPKSRRTSKPRREWHAYQPPNRLKPQNYLGAPPPAQCLQMSPATWR